MVEEIGKDENNASCDHALCKSFLCNFKLKSVILWGLLDALKNCQSWNRMKCCPIGLVSFNVNAYITMWQKRHDSSATLSDQREKNRPHLYTAIYVILLFIIRKEVQGHTSINGLRSKLENLIDFRISECCLYHNLLYGITLTK